MTENAAPDNEPAETDDERYAAIETGAGETMIYDRDNPDAWVQSSYTVEIGG